MRSLAGGYRDFLLEPTTLVTAAAATLLLAAIAVNPSGAVSSAGSHGGLYLLAALVGSVYIWWSAVQGIRERDFTADIPVSIAKAAALAIGQYSAAAVVAVLLLVGGLLEDLVAARAGRALDSLEALLPSQVTLRRAGATWSSVSTRYAQVTWLWCGPVSGLPWTVAWSPARQPSTRRRSRARAYLSTRRRATTSSRAH